MRGRRLSPSVAAARLGLGLPVESGRPRRTPRRAEPLPPSPGGGRAGPGRPGRCRNRPLAAVAGRTHPEGRVALPVQVIDPVARVLRPRLRQLRVRRRRGRRVHEPHHLRLRLRPRRARRPRRRREQPGGDERRARTARAHCAGGRAGHGRDRCASRAPRFSPRSLGPTITRGLNEAPVERLTEEFGGRMGGILTRVVPKTRGGGGGFGTPASSFGSPIECPGPRTPPENRPGAGDLKKTRLEKDGSPALGPIVSGNKGGPVWNPALLLAADSDPEPRPPRPPLRPTASCAICHHHHLVRRRNRRLPNKTRQTNSPNKTRSRGPPPPQRAREEAGGGGAGAPPRGTGRAAVAAAPLPTRPLPRGSGGTLRERAAERRIAKDPGGASRTAGGWGAAAVALSAAAAAGRPPNLL